jgi:hypothetical protein
MSICCLPHKSAPRLPFSQLGSQLLLCRWSFPKSGRHFTIVRGGLDFRSLRMDERCLALQHCPHWHEAAVLLASEAELSRAVYDHAEPVSPLPSLPSTLLVGKQSVA